jgi:transposase
VPQRPLRCTAAKNAVHVRCTSGGPLPPPSPRSTARRRSRTPPPPRSTAPPGTTLSIDETALPPAVRSQYEPTEPTVRSWVAQADRDQGVRADGLTSAEKEELRRLRRENKILRQEKEILKKAAAWFARESSSIPERDSSS